ATCYYSTSKFTYINDGYAGSSAIGVSADSGCPWSATTTATWVHLAPDASNRTGSGDTSFTYDQNTTGTARFAAIQIGVTSLDFNQPSPTSTITANSAVPVVSSSGGRATIAFNAPGNCTVLASSSASGVAAETVVNAGSVDLTIPANTSAIPRVFYTGIT